METKQTHRHIHTHTHTHTLYSSFMYLMKTGVYFRFLKLTGCPESVQCSDCPVGS